MNVRDMADLDVWRPELTRYCYRLLGSVFDADDAVQETLLRAWSHWDAVRQDTARRPWLFRIATTSVWMRCGAPGVVRCRWICPQPRLRSRFPKRPAPWRTGCGHLS
jgi:hypothetical protein